MAKKSKRHYAIEKYLGMEIPKCFLNEVCEATTVYQNCDRSTLERECARMFAYINVMEKYIEELELKLIQNETNSTNNNRTNVGDDSSNECNTQHNRRMQNRDRYFND